MTHSDFTPARFLPTRAAGLSLMADFVPAMGRRYAYGRNYDHGAGKHHAVSNLSPYIRRRLITETEVLSAALRAHGSEAADKFIDEVIWRGYFKGWLERRPQVWHSYVQGVTADLAAVDLDRRLRRDLARATDGQTGLACFDAWAQELVETGYLHNHARMWFASIWIFTLGLPWRLGADFFYRHLLDGDAASNTLGWRWAAGLHTRGKPYPARADNIATFTGGRFAPLASDLATVTAGLEGTEPEGLPPVVPLRNVTAPALGLPTALLITEEDGCLQDFNLQSYDICAAATLAASHLRSPLAVADHVTAFEAGGLTDTATRAGFAVEAMTAGDPAALALWAARTGVRQVVTPFLTQGPLQDFMAKVAPALAAQGIALCEWRRDYDAAIWPHATAGFFKVRQKIPNILAQTVPDWVQT